jgi:SAM-dependent methyltransferase
MRTSGCFDLIAADYDRNWTLSDAGVAQRDAVWRHWGRLFRRGDNVLDLGCGTGADALRLKNMGVNVVGIDASHEMVRIARSRGVDARFGSIEEIAGLEGSFDGIISNFGALNCVRDVGALRPSLVSLLKPSGVLSMCLMSRFCLFESLHYLAGRRLRKAVRRWPGHSYSATLSLDIFYPGVAQVRRALDPGFRLVRRVGIGLTIPPSYISGVSARSIAIRNRIDRYCGSWPVFRSLADHQLLIFVRE